MVRMATAEVKKEEEVVEEKVEKPKSKKNDLPPGVVPFKHKVRGKK